MVSHNRKQPRWLMYNNYPLQHAQCIQREQSFKSIASRRSQVWYSPSHTNPHHYVVHWNSGHLGWGGPRWDYREVAFLGLKEHCDQLLGKARTSRHLDGCNLLPLLAECFPGRGAHRGEFCIAGNRRHRLGVVCFCCRLWIFGDGSRQCNRRWRESENSG